MRQYFGNLSIKRKLMLIITLTSAISLFLSFAAYTANNIVLFKNRQMTRMATLASIIADNSQAAVSFNDPATAEEIINSLKSETRIEAAVIYGKDGTVFAAYKNRNFPPLSRDLIGQSRVFYHDTYLHVYNPIVLADEVIGLVYFKVDMTELQQALMRYLIFGSFIFVFCMIAAYLIALYLQKSISVPIMNLTRVAEAVSREQNYSLRAERHSSDELGELAARFNEMLQEIQKREEAILGSNEALMRSNRDLEQFTYVASHDLQEPLRIVTVYSQLLAEQYKDRLDKEGTEIIHNMIEGSQRSQQLISDLLEYSHTRSRDVVYDKMESEEALKDALSNLKIAIEESGAKITHGPLPAVYGDKMRIIQLFQNLISNAIKFKSQSGVPKIHVACRETSDEYIFSVSDNGIGISPEYLDRIFIIFQRLHTRDEYPGTGIGLSICKKIVEKHGGRIWAESKPGAGSVFYFSIRKPVTGSAF